MSKIRILAIPPDTYGVGKYRILDPFKYIGDNYSDEFHVDIVTNVEQSDEFFKNYDIVVFHSFIHQRGNLVWAKRKSLRDGQFTFCGC